MPAVIPVDDPNDPRLADYVGLTDPELRRRTEGDGGFFIVEGPLAIERLVPSSYEVRSVLVTAKARQRLGDALAHLPAEVPVYEAPEAVLRATVGFDLHRGAVASAVRPAAGDPSALWSDPTATRLLVLEGVNDHENLGSLFRNAAAFGVDGVVLDPTCADPLYRRAVRVSLGHVLGLPVARVEGGDWPGALDRLHEAGWATVALTPGGDEALDEVAGRLRDGPHGRVALLVGSEGPGLRTDTLAAARHRVRIPMASGVDSVNVATAAAIALYALR